MNATMAMTSALESGTKVTKTPMNPNPHPAPTPNPTGTKVMGEMNKQMDPIAQQKLAQQFAVENDKAQMQDEMFSDLFDRCVLPSPVTMCALFSQPAGLGAAASLIPASLVPRSMMEEGEEEEGDALVDSVLAEIGLDATTGLAAAPTAHTPVAEAEPEQVNNVDDLEARMAKLMGS